MGEKNVSTGGFVDYFLERRPSKNGFLEKVDALIDWRRIGKLLAKGYRRTASATGNPAYPPLPLFKMLLLQRWYDLSDPGLEAALYDRLSFLRFSGLSFDSPVPDETTICRFRGELLATGLHERLLREVNTQLEALGLLVRRGAIVDATVVSSSRRPRKVVEVMAEDRKEDEASGENGAEEGGGESGGRGSVVYSDDSEARWLRKGKRAHYGYKVHFATDGRGYVLGGHVTGANRADTKELERVIDGLELPAGSAVLADKGYVSASNSAALRARGLVDGIMEKAQRGRPLGFFSQLRNRWISRYRFVVEQSAGLMKRHYGLSRARYKGSGKLELELHLVGMALNLKKGVGMLGA